MAGKYTEIVKLSKRKWTKKTEKIVYKKEPIYHYNLKREWLVDEVKTIFAFQNILVALYAPTNYLNSICKY